MIMIRVSRREKVQQRGLMCLLSYVLDMCVRVFKKKERNKYFVKNTTSVIENHKNMCGYF